MTLQKEGVIIFEVLSLDVPTGRNSEVQLNELKSEEEYFSLGFNERSEEFWTTN